MWDDHDYGINDGKIFVNKCIKYELAQIYFQQYIRK